MAIALSDIGIKHLKTKDYGFRGRLFSTDEDFVVEEIESDGESLRASSDSLDVGEQAAETLIKGDFLLFTLVKKGISTQEALRVIARATHINIKRFGYLGNKDSRAVTAQRISIFKGRREWFGKEFRNIVLKDFRYAGSGCKIGDLTGNRFTVVIRDFDGRDEDLRAFSEEAAAGLPNFYGPQRFGASALNIRVSRYILQKDFRSAMSALILDERDESQISSEARKSLKSAFYDYINLDSTGNVGEMEGALSRAPPFFHTEKLVLSHLLKNRHDYAGAIRLVPKYFRLLIIQAYQAYVFNRVLSECLDNGALPAKIPTIGYDLDLTKVDNDAIAAAMKKAVEEAGLGGLEDLKIPQMPEASLKTFEREGALIPTGLHFERVGRDLRLSFELGKGSYATVLLGEMFRYRV